MTTTELTTARLTAIEHPEEVLAAVLDRATSPSRGQWLLAHLSDGVVWGIVRDGAWRLSGDEHPDLSPPLRADGLLLLRVFDAGGETFVWNDEDLGLRGRRIDDLEDRPMGDPLRWIDESRLLRGDRFVASAVASRDFTPVADASGSRHVPPLTWEGSDDVRAHPGLLHVRHHLTTDEASGCVRIVVSRCVGIAKRGSS